MESWIHGNFNLQYFRMFDMNELNVHNNLQVEMKLDTPKVTD